MGRQPKKLFPTVNIHYAHHDSVLPSKDLVKLYDEYNQKNRVEMSIMPEQKKHFSSEYKLRYNIANPEVQDNLRYMVPGEFAGKKTFKESLVNQAPEPTFSQRQQYLRHINPDGAGRYSEPSTDQYQELSDQRSYSNQEYSKQYNEGNSINQLQVSDPEQKIINYSNANNQKSSSNDLTPRKVIKVQPTEIHTAEPFQDFLDIQLNQTQVTGSNRYLDQGRLLNKSVERVPNNDLPQLKEAFRSSSIIKNSGGNDYTLPNRSNYNSFARNNQRYQQPVKFQKVDFTNLNATTLDKPSKILTEQERYLSRLRNSIERQGAIYQKHAQSIVVPLKMQSLYQLENTIQNTQLNNRNNNQIRTNPLNQSLDRYVSRNGGGTLPHVNQSIL